MKNKIILSILPLMVGLLSTNTVFAAEAATNDMLAPAGVEITPVPKESPKAFKYFGPGPQVNKDHPMRMNMPKYHSPEEMQAKKAEFEKRLNLTEEQKKQIEAQKQKDREAIKPVLDQIHQKRQELMQTKRSTTLSQEEKDKQLKKISEELKTLRVQADNQRKENMKNFEATLTAEQKKEFNKIKDEQKKAMKAKRQEIQKRIKNLKDY